MMPDLDDSQTRTLDGLDRLDDLLQHKIRLGACVLLADAGPLSFSRLKALTGATDGNLGAQLRKLEEAGYLEARKEFVDRKPVSWYSLTSEGRRALGSHLAALQSLINGGRI